MLSLGGIAFVFGKKNKFLLNIMSVFHSGSSENEDLPQISSCQNKRSLISLIKSVCTLYL